MLTSKFAGNVAKGDVIQFKDGKNHTVAGIKVAGAGTVVIEFKGGKSFTVATTRAVAAVVPQPARVKCDRCHGTGTYTWGGTVNGIPAHQGVCYHCEGKGYQTPADVKRCKNYWKYAPVLAY